MNKQLSDVLIFGYTFPIHIALQFLPTRDLLL